MVTVSLRLTLNVSSNIGVDIGDKTSWKIMILAIKNSRVTKKKDNVEETEMESDYSRFFLKRYTYMILHRSLLPQVSGYLY